MKHILSPLLILLLLGFGANLSAQQIVSVKDNGRAPYSYAGEQLDMRGLGVVLESNPEAYDLYKRAKGTSVTASILAGTGGFLFGYQIGNAINPNNGQEFNAAIFGVGLAVAGTGLLISGGANKRLTQAVELYNRDVPPLQTEPGTTLHLGASVDGLGLTFRF